MRENIFCHQVQIFFAFVVFSTRHVSMFVYYLIKERLFFDSCIIYLTREFYIFVILETKQK